MKRIETRMCDSKTRFRNRREHPFHRQFRQIFGRIVAASPPCSNAADFRFESERNGAASTKDACRRSHSGRKTAMAQISKKHPTATKTGPILGQRRQHCYKGHNCEQRFKRKLKATWCNVLHRNILTHELWQVAGELCHLHDNARKLPLATCPYTSKIFVGRGSCLL